MSKKINKKKASARQQSRKAVSQKSRPKIKVKNAVSKKNVKIVKKQKLVKMEDGDVVKAEPKERSTRAKREAVSNVYTPDQIKEGIETLSRNAAAVGYLKKNVSKRALDVIAKLVAPKTDEALALELDMKINAVRRILNILQGYGVTNYYIAKNVNGWLSFAWYINVSKLPPFFEYIDSVENKRPDVNNECNDYFVCNNCYDKTKLIFTFDAAFEESFRCGSCGKGLAAMDKEQATKLVSSATPEAI